MRMPTNQASEERLVDSILEDLLGYFGTHEKRQYEK
jgi:hypothetical protein